MMTISLSDAGKRFNREWIFRQVDYSFETGSSYAITGPNGSGKSTLLQAIAGALTLSTGKVIYRLSDQPVDDDKAYQYISISAPYLELIEEMTALELLHFHQGFKPFLPGLSHMDMLATVGIEKAAHKQIRYYSSGMKQRLKLAQAIFSDTPVLLLDEPCTNLDAKGVSMYRQLISRYTAQRILIVCSNDPQEYDFCKETLDIQWWKEGGSK